MPDVRPRTPSEKQAGGTKTVMLPCHSPSIESTTSSFEFRSSHEDLIACRHQRPAPRRRRADVGHRGRDRVAHLALRTVNLLTRHVAEVGTVGEERWPFGENDAPPYQNTVGYWWRKTIKSAGLSGIKLHDLRHFYASEPIAAGCEVVTVQRSLRHTEDHTRNASQSVMELSLGATASPWELGLSRYFPATTVRNHVDLSVNRIGQF